MHTSMARSMGNLHLDGQHSLPMEAQASTHQATLAHFGPPGPARARG